MSELLHPNAPHDLPSFITAPGDTDVLMVAVGVILIGAVLAVGNIYLRLHTLPERMAHRSQKLQFEIVAVLGLLALFTHIHLFWVAGLLLAMIDLPDFSTPLHSIAGSVATIAGVQPGAEAPPPPHDIATDDAADAPDMAKPDMAKASGKKEPDKDAALGAAQVDIIKADGQIREAKSAYQQASDDLDVKRELQRRNPGIVPQRDIEKLELLLAGREGTVDAANAAKQSAMVRVTRFFPRRRPVPRRRWHRRRSISTRLTFAPALPDASSSSRCDRAISSARSCGRRES